MPHADFPHREALCERCGYRLAGLTAAGHCPECGQAVANSHPVHRPGLPWQRRLTPGAYAMTFWGVIAGPSRAFRQMSVAGSRLPERLFLLSIAAAVGAGWAAAELIWGHDPAVLGWAWGMLAANAVVVLTYVEAAGVTYFSRRRDWRVPWPTAERVAAFASPGWLPAAAAMTWLWRLHRDGRLEQWLGQTIGPGFPGRDDLLLAGALGLVMLGFEVLVWLGVRQVRFANVPADAAPTGGEPDTPRATVPAEPSA